MKACLIQLAVLGTLAGMTLTSILLANKDPESLTPFEAWLFDSGVAVIGGTVFGVLVLGLVVAAVRKHRRVQAAWRAFADEYGLEPGEGSGQRLTGTVQGRPLQVHVWTTRSSTGNGIGPTRTRSGGGATFQELSLVAQGVPAGLNVTPREERDGVDRLGAMMISAARSIVGAGEQAPRFESGDADFDRAASLSGADPDALRAWLTPARREALLELLREDGRVRGGRLERTRQGRSEVAAELIAMLAMLESVADRLEAPA